MPRKENMLSEIHHKKGTWKVAVRITEMWFVPKGKGSSVVQMILMDKEGSKIGATLSEEHFTLFRHLLTCGNTYVLQNFNIQRNSGDWKVSSSDYTLYFVKSTVVNECLRPEIPLNVYHFTPFNDIIRGVAKSDTLVDIIGVVVDKVDEVTNTSPIRVTVLLRDKSDSEILLTVWEDYGLKLAAALEQNKIDEQPLVVMLTFGKIKEANDKYPLNVQNSKNQSKLYINPDMDEIKEDLEQLDIHKRFYTGGLSQGVSGSQSQALSFNQTGAKVIRMGDIKNLTQDLYYLTVGFVDEILVKDPWSYNSCIKCTNYVPSLWCPKCKINFEEPLPRYKLVLKFEFEDERERFTFWDQICIKMFNKTAAVCRQELIQEGEDINSFPECVDDLLGKRFALRFKYKFQYRQCSVLDFSDDEGIIEQIIARMPTKPDDCELSKGKSIAEIGNSQECFPTPDLSVSSEFDPNSSEQMTPAKRGTREIQLESYNREPVSPYQESATKHIKSE